MNVLQGSSGSKESALVENHAPELHGIAGWILSLLRSGRGGAKASQKLMRLVETLPLNGKRQLMLVECAGVRFLVGGGPESVQTMVRLDEPDLGSRSRSFEVSRDESC